MPDWKLSPREEQVLRVAAETGGSSKEIARKLGIAYKTVDIHFDRARLKMGVSGRTQALIAWIRHEHETARATEHQQPRQGFVHCPGCGGLGFVKAGA